MLAHLGVAVAFDPDSARLPGIVAANAPAHFAGLPLAAQPIPEPAGHLRHPDSLEPIGVGAKLARPECESSCPAGLFRVRQVYPLAPQSSLGAVAPPVSQVLHAAWRVQPVPARALLAESPAAPPFVRSPLASAGYWTELQSTRNAPESVHFAPWSSHPAKQSSVAANGRGRSRCVRGCVRGRRFWFGSG